MAKISVFKITYHTVTVATAESLKKAADARAAEVAALPEADRHWHENERPNYRQSGYPARIGSELSRTSPETAVIAAGTLVEAVAGLPKRPAGTSNVVLSSQTLHHGIMLVGTGSTESNYTGPERRVRAGGSPTGVERRGAGSASSAGGRAFGPGSNVPGRDVRAGTTPGDNRDWQAAPGTPVGSPTSNPPERDMHQGSSPTGNEVHGGGPDYRSGVGSAGGPESSFPGRDSRVEGAYSADAVNRGAEPGRQFGGSRYDGPERRMHAGTSQTGTERRMARI
jgi:hypothetical protein